MALTLFAENYRALTHVDWTIPWGLSVVVGANGAGKTTLLFLLELLANIALQDGGPSTAVEEFGGSRAFLHFGAPTSRRKVTLGAAHGELRWTLELLPQAGGIAQYPMEKLECADAVQYWRTAGTPTVMWKGRAIRAEQKAILRQLSQAALDAEFVGAPLVAAFSRSRIYYDYDLPRLRAGSPDSSRTVLRRDGTDAFAVLRNWRDKRIHHESFEFVRDTLSELFGFSGDLEFERGGQVVECLVRHRRYDELFPAGAAANGWLVALLHLMAVAGAGEGSVIALDDFEIALHPRAAAGLLARIKDFALERKIAVVLTTQSAQVVDFFEDQPERIFVLDPRFAPGPKPLSELRTQEWLSYFRLGHKFADGDFANETAS